MIQDEKRSGRRSIRLPHYDYSKPGGYFITVVTKHRVQLFGEVIHDRMVLNEYGQIVEEVWQDLPNHVENIMLDAFVVMPNHIHGIIVIVGAGLTPRGKTDLRSGLGTGHGAGLEPALTHPQRNAQESVVTVLSSKK